MAQVILSFEFKLYITVHALFLPRHDILHNTSLRTNTIRNKMEKKKPIPVEAL